VNVTEGNARGAACGRQSPTHAGESPLGYSSPRGASLAAPFTFWFNYKCNITSLPCYGAMADCVIGKEVIK